MKKFFFACPSLSRFSSPPSDQPGCIKTDCPECNKIMWISEKKQIIKKLASEEELYMVCYDCFENKAITDPGFFDGIDGYRHI
jgi:hypothetical protein